MADSEYIFSKPAPEENVLLSWFVLFPVICLWMGLIFAKTRFDPLHYQTVDGQYYQELASKIQHGEAYIIDGLKNKKGQSFSPYPPGYPLLLSGVSWLSTSNTLSPSLFLAGLLLVPMAWFWKKAGLPTLPWVILLFTDTALELSSFTWSEWPFFIFSTLGILAFNRYEEKPGFLSYWILFLAWMAVFLIRYAGIYVLIFIGLRIIFQILKGLSFWKELKIASGLGLGFLAWFMAEIFLSGQATGGDRYANTDHARALFQALQLEIFNQFLWFKDASGSSAISFFSALLVQILLTVWLIAWRKKTAEQPEDVQNTSKIRQYLFQAGISYLVFIVPVRWHFYFAESFDLRLLGPGFLFLLLSFFLWADSRSKISFRFGFLVCWILAAIYFTLPKKNIALKIQEAIWTQTGPVFKP
jgi:hypothetical protein